MNGYSLSTRSYAKHFWRWEFLPNPCTKKLEQPLKAPSSLWGLIPGATQSPVEFLSGKIQGCQNNQPFVLANADHRPLTSLRAFTKKKKNLQLQIRPLSLWDVYVFPILKRVSQTWKPFLWNGTIRKDGASVPLSLWEDRILVPVIASLQTTPGLIAFTLTKAS